LWPKLGPHTYATAATHQLAWSKRQHQQQHINRLGLNAGTTMALAVPPGLDYTPECKPATATTKPGKNRLELTRRTIIGPHLFSLQRI